MKKLDKLLIIFSIIGMIILIVITHFQLIVKNNWFPNPYTEHAFILVLFFWFITEIINFLYANKNSKDVIEEKVSWLLLFMTEFSLIIAVIVAGSVTYDFKEDNYHIIIGSIQQIGIILIAFGTAFREISIAVLGKSFTTSIHLESKNKVIRKWMYKYIRHPSYTGTILTLTGLPMAYGAWIGAIIVFPISIIAYSMRIREEEKTLVKKYGQEYIDYRKHTWRFFPGY
jgi:protein-S-isoprenylcysteine O-methyltransferase Ste14